MTFSDAVAESERHPRWWVLYVAEKTMWFMDHEALLWLGIFLNRGSHYGVKIDSGTVLLAGAVVASAMRVNGAIVYVPPTTPTL